MRTMNKTCPTCQEQFSKPDTESLKNWIFRHKYCSKKCYVSSMKGKDPFPNGGRKNIAGWFKGRSNTKLIGEGNPNWKGGTYGTERHKIMGKIEYKLWRDAVFARDGYTCQKTGVTGGDMECHHVLNFAEYPELRFAIDNGITLSKKSHKEFHKKYGMKNNTREQLEEYLAIVEA